MNAVINTPRTTMSPYAPRIFTLQIPTDKIRELIGPGGKVIRGIVEATGCKIDVEDDGSVKIYSSDGTAADRCIQMVTDICAVAEVGKDLPGQGCSDRRFRRVRRDLPRHRRPAAHLRNLGEPHQAGAR